MIPKRPAWDEFFDRAVDFVVVKLSQILSLKSVVEWHVDHGGGDLHAQDVDQESGKEHGLVDALEDWEAKPSGGEECQSGSQPNEDEDRLIVLDDSIDRLETLKKSAITQGLKPRHDDDAEDESDAGNESAAESCDCKKESESCHDVDWVVLRSHPDR